MGRTETPIGHPAPTPSNAAGGPQTEAVNRTNAKALLTPGEWKGGSDSAWTGEGHCQGEAKQLC